MYNPDQVSPILGLNLNESLRVTSQIESCEETVTDGDRCIHDGFRTIAKKERKTFLHILNNRVQLFFKILQL